MPGLTWRKGRKGKKKKTNPWLQVKKIDLRLRPKKMVGEKKRKKKKKKETSPPLNIYRQEKREQGRKKAIELLRS